MQPLAPVATVAKALEAVQNEVFDVAVLDVNLQDGRVYPVAFMLAERNIPFFLVSGYGALAVPPGQAWRACTKPIDPNTLTAQLLAVLDITEPSLCLTGCCAIIETRIVPVLH